MGRDGGISTFCVPAPRASAVEGHGNARMITCPIMPGPMSLMGGCGAPNMKVVEGFRREDICLTRPTENFCGFLFVNLDPDAKPMDEWFSGREELAAHVPQIDRLQPLEWVEIPEDCNWKCRSGFRNAITAR